MLRTKLRRHRVAVAHYSRRLVATAYEFLACRIACYKHPCTLHHGKRNVVRREVAAGYYHGVEGVGMQRRKTFGNVWLVAHSYYVFN